MSDFISKIYGATPFPIAAQATPQPAPSGIPGAQPVPPSVFDQTRQKYPLLSNYDLQFKQNISPNKGYMEFWSPGEMGSKTQPRPKDFDPAKPGVEVYRDDSKPEDVMGDVVSHYLVNKDPVVSKNYTDFKNSITANQRKILKDQYQWAKKNEGESRPYSEWEKMTGLPAAYRGYAFQQWPSDFNSKFYTPNQIKLGDQLNQYLTGSGP